jgi:hypothetical protein
MALESEISSTYNTKPNLRWVSNPPQGGFWEFCSREFIMASDCYWPNLVPR